MATRKTNKLILPGPTKLRRSFHHENYALFIQFYKYLVAKNMAPATISGYKHTVAEYIEFIDFEIVPVLTSTDFWAKTPIE